MAGPSTQDPLNDAITRWLTFKPVDYLEILRAIVADEAAPVESDVAEELRYVASRLNALERDLVTGAVGGVHQVIKKDVTEFIGASAWVHDLSTSFDLPIGSMQSLTVLLSRCEEAARQLEPQIGQLRKRAFKPLLPAKSAPKNKLAALLDDAATDVSGSLELGPAGFDSGVLDGLSGEFARVTPDMLSIQKCSVAEKDMPAAYSEAAQRFVIEFGRFKEKFAHYAVLQHPEFVDLYRDLVSAAADEFRSLAAWQQQALVDERHLGEHADLPNWNRMWVTVCAGGQVFLRRQAAKKGEIDWKIVTQVIDGLAFAACNVLTTTHTEKKKILRFDDNWYNRLHENAVDLLVQAQRMAKRAGQAISSIDPAEVIGEATQRFDGVCKTIGKPGVAQRIANINREKAAAAEKKKQAEEAEKAAQRADKPKISLAFTLDQRERHSIRLRKRLGIVGTILGLAAAGVVAWFFILSPRSRSKAVDSIDVGVALLSSGYLAKRGGSQLFIGNVSKRWKEISEERRAQDCESIRRHFAGSVQEIHLRLDGARLVATWADKKWRYIK